MADAYLDTDTVASINFILILFILAMVLWQTVEIESANKRIMSNDAAYTFNAARLQNEFSVMQTSINAVPAKSINAVPAKAPVSAA